MPTVLEKAVMDAAAALIDTANQFNKRMRGVEEGVRLELATMNGGIDSLRRGASAERDIQDGRDRKLWAAIDDMNHKLDLLLSRKP